MRAILSVSNKSGLVDFAKKLEGLKVDIFSTGGTRKSLTDSGLKVHSISDITGFPEILDGRVKTLHPMVHGGILARRDLDRHMQELDNHKIGLIDLVVVNLYPFVETVSRAEVTLEDALENIDIGGPTMIRAAAKNFPAVLVVVDPADYDELIEKLKAGQVDMAFRRKLAQKAFQHVALYDTAISQYLLEGENFPGELTLALGKMYNLRYGENPHQPAALYVEKVAGHKPRGITRVKRHSGPELSFNNFLDIDSAWNVASDFVEPAVAVIKHTNPCGLCSNNDLTEAYLRALAGDPVAAFGGIVAVNRVMDIGLATEVDKTHFDAIITGGYTEESLALLGRKKSLRLLSMPAEPVSPKGRVVEFRPITGGFLAQLKDFYTDEEFKPKVVTKRAPSEREWDDLFFAWKVVKHIKSNGITLARDRTLLGMGAGQPNRSVSAQIALERAGERSKGAVLGSDAFIPFPDTVELAAAGGVTAIIQVGGSIRDQQSIDAADKHGMAMVFTGVRHFKH
ncbi:MAG: bifunctional phosphoribosylaminoimidazolecarboxamide formyltransferase/IMP cyclohydrolase [Dehalococcoidia bacterium]|nr:bifunctional phosphoribosylaminoimidazolecarboxamide formyltransferase/IMP cyclohydrolase [Dehalococcoidia bacterium]